MSPDAPRPDAPAPTSGTARIVAAALLGLLAGLVAGGLAFGRRGAQAEPASPPGDDSPVVAAVGEDVLTLAELEERWRQLSAEEKSFHGARAREAGMPSARAHLLDELVDELVLAREARRRGLDRRADVRAATRACQNRILSRPLLAREVREAALPREELEAWYAQHAEQFGRPLRVQVREIVVTSMPGGPGDDTADAASARAKAEEIRARILAGEDFAALAAARSEAPSARYGGLVGWVEAGRISRSFEERALGLQPGEVSEVLEVAEGFALLKAEAREESTIPPLEEVEDAVLDQLLADDVGALQRRYNVFVGELHSRERIEVRPELVAGETRPTAPHGTAPAASPAEATVPGSPGG